MFLCHFGHFYIAHFLMSSINFELCMLGFFKFHLWIPHEKIADTYFCLLGLFPFPDLCPFEKRMNELFQQNISKTVKARALKFKE